MPLSVEIAGPEGVRWEGHAAFVIAPTVEGQIGLYPDHEPILSLLRAGEIAVEDTEGNRTELEVTGGFISFDHNTVTVIADARDKRVP